MQMESLLICERYMFRGAKAKLSGGESLAFGVQKTVFCEVKHICFAFERGVKGELKGSERDKRGAKRNVKSGMAV